MIFVNEVGKDIYILQSVSL